MPDRRRQRQQRVRQEAGGDPRSVGASNRETVKEEPPPQPSHENRPRKQGSTGVAYAAPKEYESVTIMADKEPQEPQKYQRKEILSSWLRYEDLPPEENEEEGEDYLIGEDFSTVLEQQVSTGGHLMLKGENLSDDNETSILKAHGLGALHVADLVAAINTIPLQTQLNIPESSLPESIIEFYSHLADDNKKLYQPSNNYSDCLDVNDKLLQSLKISDNEPLSLAVEVTENQENINKNAVDVALSLTNAFEPEPDEDDLDLLVPEDTQYISENVRQPSPVKEPSLPREPSPLKAPSPVKEPSPVNDSIQRKEPSPLKETISSKEPSPMKESTNVPQFTSTKKSDHLKQPSPAPVLNLPIEAANQKEKTPPKFNFGLPNTSASTMPLNFGLPKTNPSGDHISTNSVVANALKDVDLGIHSKAEEVVPEGPTVDLDAPVTQAKPVLLISETEKDDLEDWLDSVLDD